MTLINNRGTVLEIKENKMETMIDPEEYVGETVLVTARPEDDFLNDFSGEVIGVRNGFLQVRDQDSDVWEVEVSQVSKY